MPRLRLVLLAATTAVALVLGTASTSSAYTAPPVRPALPQSVGSTHFLVHYSDDPNVATRITQSQAQDVASLAEIAYSTFVTKWGYPAPASDGTDGGDGRIDIYVTDLSASSLDAAYVFDPNASIDLDYQSIEDGHLIAVALLNVIGAEMWTAPSWVYNAVGEWGAMNADGYPPVSSSDLGPWDMSLDCLAANPPTPGSLNCQTDVFTNFGQSRWPFFEFLSERYGASFVKSMFTTGASTSNSDPISVLSGLLTAKGDSFTNVFNLWAAANMSGGYTAKSLQAIVPQNPVGPVPTGTLDTLQQNLAAGSPLNLSGTIPTTTVTVGHLATKYLALEPGDGTTENTCFAATLSLSVNVPAGSGSVPEFWWSDVPSGGTKQAAQPFAINGNTATITVPWDTCNWGATYGYVSLPNPSSADGQSFVVSGTITVDPNTPASPQDPPLSATPLPGTSTGVPTSDPTPSIDVFGPGVMHVAATSGQLRIVLAASGAGNVQVAIGGTTLGTAAVRAGNNLVQFTLPIDVVQALRTAGAIGLPLTTTPQSTAGSAGTADVRQIVLDPPATQLTRADASTKSKAKAKKHVTKRRVRTRR